MSSREFAEWVAYFNVAPDPTEVTMHLTAQLLALFANVYRDKDEPPFAAVDFLPGGDRRGRLAQGMALIAQYAAHNAQRTN